MTEDSEDPGRAQVRRRLVYRLAEAGLKPVRGQTQAQQDAMADRLVEHLAYMRPEVVDVLADWVLTEAAKPGLSHQRWPSEIQVRAWAEGLQPKPFAQHPIITSWLRSVEGPQAEAGGYLVELLRHLRRYPRALTPADRRAIERQAAQNREELARRRARIEAGFPWEDDHQVIAQYEADQRTARAMVDQGNAARAAKDTAA